MYLHELKSPAGSRKRPQRIGRGTGSGRGKTSGRGQKGQNARSEGFRLGFEGGQMPLAQRIPKLPGFKNRFKKVYAVVNIVKLNIFDAGATVNANVLAAAGLVRHGEEVKVLGTGGLERKLTVEAHAFSNSARSAIEGQGGTVKVLGEPRVRGPKRSRKSPEAAPAAQNEEGGSTPAEE
jgi:large subunit ribosomal protein L15